MWKFSGFQRYPHFLKVLLDWEIFLLTSIEAAHHIYNDSLFALKNFLARLEALITMFQQLQRQTVCRQVHPHGTKVAALVRPQHVVRARITRCRASAEPEQDTAIVGLSKSAQKFMQVCLLTPATDVRVLAGYALFAHADTSLVAACYHCSSSVAAAAMRHLTSPQRYEQSMLSSGIGAAAVTTWCMMHGQSPGEAAAITVVSTITALVSGAVALSRLCIL